MDRSTVLTKTAKGLMETSGKTSLLSRDLRDVLKEVDGRGTVGELQKRLDRPEPKLLEALKQLVREGFIREFVTVPKTESPPTQSPVVDEDDLDFTAAPSKAAPKAAAVPVAQVRNLEAERQQREAEEIARTAAATRAKELAAAKQKLAAETAQRALSESEAQAKAKAVALAQAQAQAKARVDEVARADGDVKRKAEAAPNADAEALQRRCLRAPRRKKKCVVSLRKKSGVKPKNACDWRPKPEPSRRRRSARARMAQKRPDAMKRIDIATRSSSVSSVKPRN